MKRENYLDQRSFLGGFLDVLGATSFGCLLTLAFVSPINAAQKASLCIFSIIMPILAMLRLQLCELGTNPNKDDRDEIKVTGLLLRIICIPLCVGMTLFIWGIWCKAAWLALLSSSACAAVTYRRWKRTINYTNPD